MDRILKGLIFLIAAICICGCNNNSQLNYTPERELVMLNETDSCYSYFNINTIEFNGTKLFLLSKKELIDTLKLTRGLTKLNQNEDFYYFPKSNSYIEFDELLNRIFIIEIVDSSIIISNIELGVNVAESELEKRYPELYKLKSLSPSFGKDTEEITLHDCKMNRIRIFLFENKINSISYWADDDPSLYEEFER